MTKNDFLAQLEAALAALPSDEREEALRYYGDYFDESGLAETEVISRLGSPAEVADTILRDFYTGAGRSWNTKIPYTAPGGQGDRADRSFQATVKRIGATLPAWAWIIIAVLAFPIWGPVLLSAIGVFFGMLCAVFSVLLALCATIIGLVGGGVSVLTSGLITLFASPPASLMTIGGGMLLIALGLLIAIPTIWLWSLVPKAFRAISDMFRRTFSGNKEVAA